VVVGFLSHVFELFGSYLQWVLLRLGKHKARIVDLWPSLLSGVNRPDGVARDGRVLIFCIKLSLLVASVLLGHLKDGLHVKLLKKAFVLRIVVVME
jgi:hypothetical protein